MENHVIFRVSLLNFFWRNFFFFEIFLFWILISLKRNDEDERKWIRLDITYLLLTWLIILWLFYHVIWQFDWFCISWSGGLFEDFLWSRISSKHGIFMKTYLILILLELFGLDFDFLTYFSDVGFLSVFILSFFERQWNFFGCLS